MLREDGKLIAATHFDLSQMTGPSAQAAAKARDYVRRHWKYSETDSAAGPSAQLLERAQSYALCISGMAFQDVWNVDLERLRRCCVHVLTEDGRLVPFCSYYMTDMNGRRSAKLHR